MRKENLLWVEKYRPKTIEDCILPKNLKKTFLDFVNKQDIPNMILAGPAGGGKTTVAKALCNELAVDSMIVNASEEGGIDTLRNKIRQYASSMCLDASQNYKVVILDEADYLSPAAQPALRGFIEEFSSNCRFILTCNFKNRIISPLHSRCTVIDYNESNVKDPKIAALFMKRMQKILAKEEVSFDNQAIANVIMKYSPDWRRVINECQRFSVSGSLSTEIVVSNDDAMKSLVGYLKKKEFKKVLQWCSQNSDIDSSVVFNKIYDSCYSLLDTQSIPSVIITLNDYQFKSTSVPNQELNLVACLTEIMTTASFK
jgi:DNA polymerase III delta prime subunit